MSLIGFIEAKKLKKRRKNNKPPLNPRRPSPPPLSVPKRIGCLGKLVKVLPIVGLLITLLGLVTLIELYPRLSASVDSSSSIPGFTVTNEGYLKVTNVVLTCFIWKATTEEDVTFGPAYNIGSPPGSRLNPDEGYSITCLEHAISPQPRFVGADLAIVASYRPWPFTFLRLRRFFRFVARPLPQGGLAWDKQPSESIEKEFDRQDNDP